GSDVYVDSKLIALELERRYPRPSLFPDADLGTGLALISWCDVFFRSALKIILATSSHTWPEAFRKDREMLFPDIDFRTVAGELDHSKSQYRAHASLLERQLADGRAFLSGDHPGLMDAFVHPFVWVVRTVLPSLAQELLGDFRNLQSWEGRVAERGEGRRARIQAGGGLAEGQATQPPTPSGRDPPHAQKTSGGMPGRAGPAGTRRPAATREGRDTPT